MIEGGLPQIYDPAANTIYQYGPTSPTAIRAWAGGHIPGHDPRAS